jgi:IS30 family transposase
MGGTRLSAAERAEVRRLAREGRSFREIGGMVGRAPRVVTRVVRGEGRHRYVDWAPAGRLSLEEREEISRGLRAGESLSAVARRIGRAPSTVSREVAAGGGRDRYRAAAAHRGAFARARRPKPAKPATTPALAAVVAAWLGELWSPQQIARRLRVEFPDDPMMRVSHETIYLSLYVQGRGELRRELARCLRTGRAARRPGGRLERRGRIPGMVTVSERPPEAADRAVPGHWEGDLIMGRGGRSAVGTLVERATRFVMLLHLPDGHGAGQVREAMAAAITTLPRKLARSVTWDQGAEMAQHARFRVDTGVDVYFCDPHSPWQRGSNENTNGLLRQYMPKGTDLSVYTREDLDRIARSLNNRPRQTLGWMKPSEKLAEFLATTG